jgi:hypothetical protein
MRRVFLQTYVLPLSLLSEFQCFDTWGLAGPEGVVPPRIIHFLQRVNKSCTIEGTFLCKPTNPDPIPPSHLHYQALASHFRLLATCHNHLGPGTGQLGHSWHSRAHWNYSKQPLLSLFPTLLFLSHGTTIKALASVFPSASNQPWDSLLGPWTAGPVPVSRGHWVW